MKYRHFPIPCLCTIHEYKTQNKPITVQLIGRRFNTVGSLTSTVRSFKAFAPTVVFLSAAILSIACFFSISWSSCFLRNDSRFFLSSFRRFCSAAKFSSCCSLSSFCSSLSWKCYHQKLKIILFKCESADENKIANVKCIIRLRGCERLWE